MSKTWGMVRRRIGIIWCQSGSDPDLDSGTAAIWKFRSGSASTWCRSITLSTTRHLSPFFKDINKLSRKLWPWSSWRWRRTPPRPPAGRAAEWSRLSRSRWRRRRWAPPPCGSGSTSPSGAGRSRWSCPARPGSSPGRMQFVLHVKRQLVYPLLRGGCNLSAR